VICLSIFKSLYIARFLELSNIIIYFFNFSYFLFQIVLFLVLFTHAIDNVFLFLNFPTKY